jgi:hypothetical protein
MGGAESLSMLGWTALLPGLKSIHVLWVPQGTFDESESDTKEAEGETVKQFTKRIKASFQKTIKGKRCTATNIHVLDREGNYY